MANLFDNFDFQLLDSPEFREDSVREELVVPLVKALGYSASPPYRIIRSKKLKHPFVYFGTVKKDITIIPDYLFERDGQYAWILDAKAPNENIDTGKNVEQAYSYAMHRDVRVPLYGLCNGRKLTVFHVTQEQPVIDVALRNIKGEWQKILAILGCKSVWPNSLRPGFQPDFGLALSKAGFAVDGEGKKYFQIFVSLPILMATKVEDDLYTLNALVGSALFDDEENQTFMASFDFGSQVYPSFLEQFGPELGEKVRSELSRQPYRAIFSPEDTPMLTFAAEIGDTMYRNEDESYRPLNVTKFI
jgi:hypothetical protein